MMVCVRLVPDRLGGAGCGQNSQFAELRQGGVDRAAAELGQGLRRPGVHLVSGKVLGHTSVKGPEDGPALRRAAQPAGAERLPGLI